MSKFKSGDVVVLVEADYADGFLTSLAKEKHLFEVIGWGHEVINLKSISTNIKARIYEKHIRHATLKEQYLRTGNVVKLKSGATFIVIDNYITNLYAWENNDNFNDDLTNESIEESNIIEVYNFNSLIRNGNRIGTLNMMLEVNEHSLHKLIWERKPKIKTPHQKLLDLGFKYTEYNYYNTYKNDYITIDINTLRKGYNVHNVKHNMNYIVGDRNNKNYIDLELAEILADYLKELQYE